MAKLTFNGREYQVSEGKSLKRIFAEESIPFTFPCGGRKACGKCRVTVREGQVSPPSEDEKRLLSPTLISMGVRLACATVIEGDAIIDAFTDESSFLIETGAPVSLPTDGEEGLGLAVDLGTTTVAAAFYDRKSGRLIKEYSALNPQREAGIDVLSRIEYASKKDGIERLQGLIIGLINGFIEDLKKSSPKFTTSVVNFACICGNTAMELLFGGFEVATLGEYPFTPPSLLGITLRGEVLGLRDVEEVYMMPCAGPFFGGDAVGAMVHGGFWGAKEPLLMADIGTNCEIAVTEDGKTFWGLSAAAGPAFEGGEITFGCGSVHGAIKRVKSLVATPEVETVGRGKPCGICGSGIIDALAVGLEEGLISPDGLLGSYSPLLEDLRAIRLAGEIYLTQTDIRKAQLAKAAVAAGSRILLNKVKALPQKTLLTGGFGRGIDPRSAKRIGLLPEEVAKEIIPLGNGALKGTAAALLCGEIRKKAEQIAKNTVIISPTQEEEFEDIFTSCMKFDQK